MTSVTATVRRPTSSVLMSDERRKRRKRLAGIGQQKIDRRLCYIMGSGAPPMSRDHDERHASSAAICRPDDVRRRWFDGRPETKSSTSISRRQDVELLTAVQSDR